ncbi:MAG TPA: AraC family transcriptional regulator [Armatimonadota bacterium]|jgi:AraC-like DNA-binding protein
MPEGYAWWEQLLGDSLSFEYCEGAVSSVAACYSTGTRIMPMTVINQWRDDVLLEVSGGPAVRVCGGAGIVMPSGLAHRITVIGPSATRCRWAHVQFTVLGAVDLLSMLSVPHVVLPAVGEQLGDITEVLVSLHGVAHEFSWDRMIRTKSLGFDMLTQLCAQLPEGQLSLDVMRQSQRLLPVLRFIQEHLAEEFGRNDLAALLGLSPTHFHTLFKSALGVAPMEYVKHQRIRQAQRLLVETALPVARIAEVTGFRDPFHFSRIFKETSHLSPTQYRQRIRDSLLSR